MHGSESMAVGWCLQWTTGAVVEKQSLSPKLRGRGMTAAIRTEFRRRCTCEDEAELRIASDRSKQREQCSQDVDRHGPRSVASSRPASPAATQAHSLKQSDCLLDTMLVATPESIYGSIYTRPPWPGFCCHKERRKRITTWPYHRQAALLLHLRSRACQSQRPWSGK